MSRVAYAAAHVVADPLATNDPGAPARARLGGDAGVPAPSVGAGARRGRGDGHRPARHGPRLGGDARADRAARAPRRAPAAAAIACGAGTDQLAARPASAGRDRRRLRGAVRGRRGARAHASILMASRALAASARGPEDYARVYARVLVQRRASRRSCTGSAPMFDPALAGYWGSHDLDAAIGRVPRRSSPPTRRRSTASRSRCSTPSARSSCARRLPDGRAHVHRRRLQLPGADPGDGRLSDALLGIFDAIAPAAAAALAALDAGDDGALRGDPRADGAARPPHVRRADPHYKTGIVFLAWLTGHQDALPHGRRAGERALGRRTCARLFVLADRRRPAAGPRACRGADARSLAAGWRRDPRDGADVVRLASTRSPPTAGACARPSTGCARAGIGCDRAVARQGGRGGRRGSRRARGARRRADASPACAAAASSPRPARGAIDDNRRAIEEAATLGTDLLVLVCGGLPEGSRDLAGARAHGRATGSPPCSTTPPPPACGWASSRCTRCSAPTARSSRRSARPTTWPSASRRAASASWSTPTTCGGTRAVYAEIAARRAHPRLPHRRLGAAAAGGRAARPRAARRGLRRPAGAATARSTAAGYAGPVEVEVLSERRLGHALRRAAGAPHASVRARRAVSMTLASSTSAWAAAHTQMP